MAPKLASIPSNHWYRKSGSTAAVSSARGSTWTFEDTQPPRGVARGFSRSAFRSPPRTGGSLDRGSIASSVHSPPPSSLSSPGPQPFGSNVPRGPRVGGGFADTTTSSQSSSSSPSQQAPRPFNQTGPALFGVDARQDSSFSLGGGAADLPGIVWAPPPKPSGSASNGSARGSCGRAQPSPSSAPLTPGRQAASAGGDDLFERPLVQRALLNFEANERANAELRLLDTPQRQWRQITGMDAGFKPGYGFQRLGEIPNTNPMYQCSRSSSLIGGRISRLFSRMYSRVASQCQCQCQRMSAISTLSVIVCIVFFFWVFYSLQPGTPPRRARSPDFSHPSSAAADSDHWKAWAEGLPAVPPPFGSDENNGKGSGASSSSSSTRGTQHWSTHVASEPALRRSFYPTNSTYHTLPRK